MNNGMYGGVGYGMGGPGAGGYGMGMGGANGPYDPNLGPPPSPPSAWQVRVPRRLLSKGEVV